MCRRARRADSVLGCPGMINAARSGTVAIANAVGNGVADDKLLYTYIPDRVALPEGELIVNSSRGGGSKDTWVLGDPDTHVAHPDDADSGRSNSEPTPRPRGRAPAGRRPGRGAG